MSYTYSDLRADIVSDSKRSDLFTETPRFIRLAEGLIRRDLTAYELTATLTDADRVTDGVYTLPTGFQQDRSVHVVGRTARALNRVSANQSRVYEPSADVVQYTIHGDGTIEFRGVPSESDTFDLRYFGMPEPLETTATNALLTDHEGLYLSGALYYLYMNEQSTELAGAQAQTFDAIMERINEMMKRRLGGNASAPLYNMTSRSSY